MVPKNLTITQALMLFGSLGIYLFEGVILFVPQFLNLLLLVLPGNVKSA